MSGQKIRKKEDEINALLLFSEAYWHTTSERLDMVELSERPDFVCKRSDGTLVGVELTRVMRDPQSAQTERILMRMEYRDSGEVVDAIWIAAEDKSRKLKMGNWHHADNTILVLQVMDCPLTYLWWLLDEIHSPTYYSEFGFSEIWLADYSELDAYRVIELFGLYPGQWWGYHERYRGKPYG